MDSKKAEKFERHRKELRKKAFLNISIVILVATGLAFYVGGYTADFLFMLFSTNFVVLFCTFFVAALVLIWSLPLLHYREEVQIESDKGKKYFMDRKPEKSTIIQILKERGWREAKSDEQKVKLETYPTLFHRLINKETSLVLEEEEEKEENLEKSVLKSEGKEVSRIKTEYQEREEGLLIKETTVSRTRVSPIYVEVTLYLMPELEKMMEDAEEDVEITDERMDYGLKQYEFK